MRAMLRMGWLCVVCLGCGTAGAPPAPIRDVAGVPAGQEAQSGEADAGDDYVIGEPSRYENLTIFPVLTKTERTADRFTTLDEGLRAGTVHVYEVGAWPGRTTQSRRFSAEADEDSFADSQSSGNGSDRSDAQDAPESNVSEVADENDADADESNGELAAGNDIELEVGASVNRLLVLNGSDKPLYLMPGEIIIGGQQDRSIAEETIIPPGEKPTAVNVYCVESGRWNPRGAVETADMLGALAETVTSSTFSADLALGGKFTASAGALDKGSRQVVQEGKGQRAVWDKVAEKNAEIGDDYDAVTFAVNYIDPDVTAKWRPFVETISDELTRQERVVGVIVAINGKVESVDIFESTPLFQKLWPKLVKSYALDAAGAATDEESESAECTVADAQAFLNETREAQVEKTGADRGLVVTVRSSERVSSFSAGFGGMGGGMGGFGGVHSSGFAK